MCASLVEVPWVGEDGETRSRKVEVEVDGEVEFELVLELDSDLEGARFIVSAFSLGIGGKGRGNLCSNGRLLG